MKLDILAIGVHPDDVELSCAGILINEIKNGKKVGIVDLTQGELGTRGTAETRKFEAEAAAKIMGVSIRENLKMRDGFFKNDENHQMHVISILRKYRPEIVIGNVLSDRHPDHGRAGALINDACFLSGLRKIETLDMLGNPQEKWRPKYCFQYIQDWYHEPDLIIDISHSFDQKLQAIEAYQTQFFGNNQNTNEPQTYISTAGFKESIIANSRLMGKKIGVQYGEGLLSTKKLGINNLSALILNET